jgi:hypothetical protein
MCLWLHVSRSGFYEWRTRPQSATLTRRRMLAELIQQVFDDAHGTYGYRRVHSRVTVDRQAVVGAGSQVLPVRAAWMASMARMPWLRADAR